MVRLDGTTVPGKAKGPVEPQSDWANDCTTDSENGLRVGAETAGWNFSELDESLRADLTIAKSIRPRLHNVG
jgi:hypothetical protein